MQLDATARQLLEDYARSAAQRSGLAEPQATDARLELYSHLHDAATAHAQAEEADMVSVTHVRRAIAAMGTPEATDAAFFAPRRAAGERAPFVPRAVAYFIDFTLALVAFGVLSSTFLTPMWVFWFMPFLPPLLAAALIILSMAALEATRGQTIGKMALRLRATTINGGPLSWETAILRNLTKCFPPLALLDAMVGHLSDGAAKQRVTDRLVETIVVKEGP